jgi:hypothetical protein
LAGIAGVDYVAANGDTDTRASWMAAKRRSQLCTTHINQAGILYGIAALPTVRRRTARRWWFLMFWPDPHRSMVGVVRE